MAPVVHPRTTADAFDALLGVIGPRHELIEGEVVVVVPDGVAAARASARLARALEAWVAGPDGRGEVLVDCFVRLDDGNQLGPDVAWYAEAPVETSGAVRSRVPDVVVEVLSPSTRGNDLGVKADVYRRAGVAEYWVVDPEAGTAALARFADGEASLVEVDELRSLRLPGFAHRVGTSS